MPRRTLIVSLLPLIIFAAVYGAERKIIIDSLVVSGDHLLLGYHIENLMNEKVIEGLQRGFTSEIVHHIQVWRSKRLFSQIACEKFYSIKVYYDNWEGKFAIATESENRLTANVETLRRICSAIENLVLADTTTIEKNAKYYLTIQTTFQPISNESYQELRNWVSGRSQSEAPPKAKAAKRGRIFGVLLDLMGFGDKVVSFKSGTFILRPPSHIEFLD